MGMDALGGDLKHLTMDTSINPSHLSQMHDASSVASFCHWLHNLSTELTTGLILFIILNVWYELQFEFGSDS